MPIPTLIRAAGALALLVSLGGCYGAPATYQPSYPGTPYSGAQCYAGAYVCQLPTPGAIGSTCSCPGLGAPSFGTIR